MDDTLDFIIDAMISLEISEKNGSSINIDVSLDKVLLVEGLHCIMRFMTEFLKKSTNKYVYNSVNRIYAILNICYQSANSFAVFPIAARAIDLLYHLSETPPNNRSAIYFTTISFQVYE